MTKKLQGAVLVIGSLYWENEQNAIELEKGRARQAWRDEHLRLDLKMPVGCPIRYGRVSTKRFNTYTMVFAGDVAALGTGLVLPLRHSIEGPSWLMDIFKEALELSRA